ncbi:hypothetical protein F5890DRAFT_1478767 [Lentinula detonsa]|uniref:Uncharacterized protein n=1 Tax=Lentinula detonsa TaxID=2804962 RepID=A0AA38PP39_9AGAR|nr:hypothetical protein F5890DRAFT_1478767 [Lentinula detonsa]
MRKNKGIEITGELLAELYSANVGIGSRNRRLNAIRIHITAVPSGDPEGDDPNPGDDSNYHETESDDDNDKPEPSSPLPKQSRCSRCILKAFKCEMEEMLCYLIIHVWKLEEEKKGEDEEEEESEED